MVSSFSYEWSIKEELFILLDVYVQESKIWGPFVKLLGRVQTFFQIWAFAQRQPQPNLNFNPGRLRNLKEKKADLESGQPLGWLIEVTAIRVVVEHFPPLNILTHFLNIDPNLDSWADQSEREDGCSRKYLVETSKFELEGMSLLIEWAHQLQKVLWAWLKSRAKYPREHEQPNEARSYTRYIYFTGFCLLWDAKARSYYDRIRMSCCKMKLWPLHKLRRSNEL